MSDTPGARDMPHVTAYLCVDRAADAIEWYKRAFGARERFRLPGAGGRLGHAEIAVGQTVLYLSGEWAEQNVLAPTTLKGNSVSFVLAVPDADRSFDRAVDAGAVVERPLKDEPYGRGGWVRDPFGHRWSIMTPNPDFNPDDMQSS